MPRTTILHTCHQTSLVGSLAVILVVSLGTPPPALGQPAYAGLPWVSTDGPLGGLGYDIRYNFGDPSIWYVTDAWSGVHRSTDRGISWAPTNTGMSIGWGPAGDTIPIFSLTVDPHNPSIVWAGTQNTGQIFKSTNGGLIWTEMSNGIDQTLIPHLSFRGFTVAPTGSDTVYAMGEIGSPAWTADGSEAFGRLFDRTMGVVYRSEDGGLNWTELRRPDNLARYCWVNPTDADELYVSTGIHDREAANTDVGAGDPGGVGILKSTDGGATWDVIDKTEGLSELFVSSLYMDPSDPATLLAATSNDAWSTIGPNHTGAVSKTTNGGADWEPVRENEFYSGVEFCPSDPDVAYAASSRAVHRSDDGGTTWVRFNRDDGTWGSPGLVAGIPIDMQCDPEDPMRIAINNYLGGNFLSRNGGQTWLSASEGYTGALVRGIDIAPGRPSTVFVGSRSGVFRSEDSGEHWVGTQYPPDELLRTGDPIKLTEITAVVVHPSDGNHVLAASRETVLMVSRDEGRSWSLPTLPADVLPPLSLAFAPSAPSIVYAGTGSFDCMHRFNEDPVSCDQPGMGVLASEDGGNTWQRAAGTELAAKSVLTVAVDPGDEDALLAGTYSSGVYKTENRGASWSQVGSGLPSLPVLALSIHPLNGAIVFAGLKGGAIYKSVDGGDSFSQSSAGLDPNAIVYSVVVDLADAQVVYAADILSGVYVSTDAGATWQAISQGLDHRAVKALALTEDGTALYAGVEGAGVWRLGPPPSETAVHDTCTQAIEIEPGTYAEQFASAGVDGAASCASPAGDDLWYRYTATGTGTLHVSTCGTHDRGVIDAGIDTVVSAHSSCPGTPATELPGGCSDDWTIGSDPSACELFDFDAPADGAVAVPVQAGDEVWIRVGRRSPAAQGEFWLTVELGLFADGFESGDTTAWADAVGWYAGDLAIAANAARIGGYGLKITVGNHCSAPDDLVLTPPPLLIEGEYLGCRSVLASGVRIGGTGATFAAGESIRLGEGFSVLSGSPFGSTLDPGLATDLAYLRDVTPDGHQSYSAAFELRLDSLAISEGDTIEIFNGYSGNGEAQFKLTLNYDWGVMRKQLLLSVRQDDGSFVTTPAGEELPLQDGWNKVEIDWQTGAGTGSFEVELNDAAMTGFSAIDNDAQRLDEVRLGNAGGTSTTTSGSMDFDDFVSRP